MTKQELENLRESIRKMQRGYPLYKILKEELSKLGYWRVKPRGDHKKGFKMGWGKHKT